MKLNDIVSWRVTKLETFERSKKFEDLTIGCTIGRDMIESVIDRAIRNEIYIIAREDGCRFFSFGYDFDAWICSKFADVLPDDATGIRVSDISEDLIKTDWYDN